MSGRVVLLGAKSRIGLRLYDELTRLGRHVVPTSTRHVNDAFHVPLDDPETLATAVELGDVLVLLTNATPARGTSDMGVNVEIASVVAQVATARRAGRIVFASSAAVYGDQRDVALRETDPPAPTSDYGRSKLTAETVLRQFDGEVVALRIFNVFGPGFDESLVAKILGSTAQGGFTTKGSDDFVRDYVHVSLVAEALAAACFVALPEAHATINVGSGVRVSTRELVSNLSRQAPVDVTFGEGPSSWSWADTTLMDRILGVSPVSPFAFL